MEYKFDENRHLREDDLSGNMTFHGRWLVMKATFYGKQPLIEDNLRWKSKTRITFADK